MPEGGVTRRIRDYLSRTNVQLGATYKTGKLSTERYGAGFAAGARYVHAEASEIGTASTAIIITVFYSASSPPFSAHLRIHILFPILSYSTPLAISRRGLFRVYDVPGFSPMHACIQRSKRPSPPNQSSQSSAPRRRSSSATSPSRSTSPRATRSSCRASTTRPTSRHGWTSRRGRSSC